MIREEHIIKNCPEAMRLDRYIKLEKPEVTHALIEKTIRKGLIRVNKKKAKSSDRIHNGDIIEYRVEFKVDDDREDRPVDPNTIELADKILGEYLIFDSDEFMVINKPSGVSSQGGTKVRFAIDDALSYLNKKFFSTDKVYEGYRLVHRLDKDTSGVFLVAKNRLAATKLAKAFEEKLISKKYLAIVEGKPKQQSATIVNYLIKDGFKQIQKTAIKGDYAETDYKVLRSSTKTSLILFMPKTGRMHQLRVHAKELGCPIVGDAKYGAQDDKKLELFLHAYAIEIPKEIFGKHYEFKAKLPKVFEVEVSKNFGAKIEEFLE